MSMSFLPQLRLLLPLVAVVLSGCQSYDISSLPFADNLGLSPLMPVPPEIAERYGPTANDRIEEIKRQKIAAKKGSPAERETIAKSLAEQIHGEPNAVLRQEIIRSIAQCKTPLAGMVMRAGLNDKDPDVQIQSCREWGDWGTTESVQLLGAVLGNDRSELDVKLAAVSALADTGRPQAAPPLSVALTKGADPALQHQAIVSLRKITGRDFGNDLAAWRDFVDQAQADPSQAEGATFPSVVQRTLFWWR
jgi:HEAT repeat protein